MTVKQLEQERHSYQCLHVNGLGMESPSFLRFGFPSEVESPGLFTGCGRHSQAAKLLHRWWEGEMVRSGSVSER